MTDQFIEVLAWDSKHFGCRIARARRRQVDLSSCKDLVAECQSHDIDCLYFLADASDQTTIAALQSCGFDFVDIRITLSAQYNVLPAIGRLDSIRFRLGQERDLGQLLPIAGASYSQSRFYIDRRFGHDRATQMFQIWLRKSFGKAPDAAVVVAERNDSAVGFVTCHLHKPPGEGNIGLVGVAESARGLGCAGGMIKYAARWFAGQGLHRLNVVTQGRNIAAQRLYQRSGFVTRSVELWFHKWFD